MHQLEAFLKACGCLSGSQSVFNLTSHLLLCCCYFNVESSSLVNTVHVGHGAIREQLQVTAAIWYHTATHCQVTRVWSKVSPGSWSSCVYNFSVAEKEKNWQTREKTKQCLDQRTKQEEAVINPIFIYVCWALLCRSCDLQQRLFKGINPQPAKEDDRACLLSSEDKSNSASSGLKKLICWLRFKNSTPTVGAQTTTHIMVGWANQWEEVTSNHCYWDRSQSAWFKTPFTGTI